LIALLSGAVGYWGKSGRFSSSQEIGIYKKDRFNLLLKSLHVISPRVLATRLKELEQAGLITPVERRKSHPMIVRWALTEKGIDTIPIMMMMTASASKWQRDEIFDDKRPRKLHELFTDEAMELVRRNF